MSIRFHLPTAAPAADHDRSALPTLETFAGKRLVFLQNYRSRNNAIRETLVEVLVGRLGAVSLDRFRINHGNPEPPAKLLPLTAKYDAVIGAFGG